MSRKGSLISLTEVIFAADLGNNDPRFNVNNRPVESLNLAATRESARRAVGRTLAVTKTVSSGSGIPVRDPARRSICSDRDMEEKSSRTQAISDIESGSTPKYVKVLPAFAERSTPAARNAGEDNSTPPIPATLLKTLPASNRFVYETPLTRRSAPD